METEIWNYHHTGIQFQRASLVKVYPVSYITNEIKLCTKLSKLWIVSPLSGTQQTDAIRKFNVNVWHLQWRNIGKAN